MLSGRGVLYPPFDPMWLPMSLTGLAVSEQPMWTVCLKSVGDPIMDLSIRGLFLWPEFLKDPPGTQQVKHWDNQDSEEFIPARFRATQLVMLSYCVSDWKATGEGLIAKLSLFKFLRYTCIYVSPIMAFDCVLTLRWTLKKYSIDSGKCYPRVNGK
jgi:hypothetical protein